MRTTGLQAVVAWHAAQAVVALMWRGPGPVERTPSWHAAQSPVLAECVNVAGFQATVAWQVSQPAVVGTCSACLPVADRPSWHDAQVPLTCVWSTCATGAQPVTAWQ